MNSTECRNRAENVLMHTYGRYTLDILREYVPAMQAMGYEFVTVSDLMLPGGEIDEDARMYLPDTIQE